MSKVRIIESSAKYVSYLWELRWRLEYVTRPARAGLWTQPGNTDSTTASKQPLDGIARAVVEAKNRQTREIFAAAEVVGPDFIEFRWVAAAPLPMAPSALDPRMQFRFAGSIQGMTLVTRDEKVHVYINGQVVREPNAEGPVLSHHWKY